MKIYICSIEELRDAASFDAASLKITQCRRDKLSKIKGDADRRRSVCAGLLLNYAVASYKAEVAGVVTDETVIQEFSVQQLLRTTTQSYEYCQDGNSKPYIADLPEFHFSLSHSGDYVLCAWDFKELGADLQCMDREIKDTLAKRSMTEEEYKIYSALSVECRNKEFYRIWTMKESYCKLTGKGLAQDFREIEADKINCNVTMWKENYWMAVSLYK